jgi:hypothetical protein
VSAGSGHHFTPSDSLRRELKTLLSDPKVKSCLARSYKVSYAYPIPLTGGSSVDGRTFYIHPDVQKSDRPHVLLHERIEKALREALGMSYDRAHRLATMDEHESVGASKWKAYKERIGKIVQENEHPSKTPKDLDTGPYRESGLMRLIASR